MKNQSKSMTQIARTNVYRIEVSPAAGRDLNKLKSRIHRADFERIRDAVTSLVKGPRSQEVRKIKSAENAYRVRVGSFRIVYEVYDNEKLNLLLQVVHRSKTTYHKE